MTQQERVLERLKNGRWLPMLGRLRRSPPTRHLEARVGDLRPGGHSIIERRAAGKFYSERSARPQASAGDTAGEPRSPEGANHRDHFNFSRWLAGM